MLSWSSFGQSNERPFYFVELDFNVVQAQDRFDDLLDGRGLNTLEIVILRQFNNQDAWFAGASFTLKNYDELTDGFETIKSGYFDLSAVIRHYPDLGWWRLDPYIQGLAGIRTFKTNTFIEVDENTTEQNNNHRDSSLLFGGGVGLTVMVIEQAHLNIGAQYLFGGATTYLLDNGQGVFPLIDNLEEYFSITNTIKYQIGATFVF
jgi:hypothetical protein